MGLLPISTTTEGVKASLVMGLLPISTTTEGVKASLVMALLPISIHYRGSYGQPCDGSTTY